MIITILPELEREVARMQILDKYIIASDGQTWKDPEQNEIVAEENEIVTEGN